MEALVFDPISLSLKYHKYYPIPEISNDDEVIVRVDHTGVCGTDLLIIQGDFPVRNDRPFPLGHEFSGFIPAMGKNSTFKLGQRVAIDPNSGCQLCDCCRYGKYQNCLTAGLNSYIGIFKDGGWAKYCKVLKQQVYVLPDDITNKQACLAETLSCVAHSFNRAGPLKVGEKILIIGAGIIGKLFATALYYHGHRNVTISENIEKRKSMIFDKELTIIGVKTSSFSFLTALEWIKVMGERYLDYHKLGVKTYWLSEYESAKDLKTGRAGKIIFKTASLPLM